MNQLTITGIPASIPRPAYLATIEALGIDPAQMLELKWGWETITATVYALNEHGSRYADHTGEQAAVHHISIPIVDDQADE